MQRNGGGTRPSGGRGGSTRGVVIGWVAGCGGVASAGRYTVADCGVTRFAGAKPMLDVVLFDLGDTLIHFETSRAAPFLDTALRPAYERLAAQGFALPAERVYRRRLRRAFIRASIWSKLRRREVRILRTFERVHRRLGVRLDHEHMVELAHLCTAELRRFFTTDEHAVSVVGRVREMGFRLGVVSNTPFPGFAIDDVLRRDGLLDFFPVRIYSSDAGYRKPHPEIFRIALRRMGAKASQSIYIGDRLDNDVRGAARVGMRTVLFSRNGAVPHGRGRPDFAIMELTQLPDLLRTLGGAVAS